MTEPTKLVRKPLATVQPLSSPEPQAKTPVEVPQGFDRISVPASELEQLSANQAPRPPRRKRVTGRTIQFNVKLTQETIDFIYEVANSRNIPLAQVMEEFVEAFKATSR